MEILLNLVPPLFTFGNCSCTCTLSLNKLTPIRYTLSLLFMQPGCHCNRIQDELCARHTSVLPRRGPAHVSLHWAAMRWRSRPADWWADWRPGPETIHQEQHQWKINLWGLSYIIRCMCTASLSFLFLYVLKLWFCVVHIFLLRCLCGARCSTPGWTVNSFSWIAYRGLLGTWFHNRLLYDAAVYIVYRGNEKLSALLILVVLIPFWNIYTGTKPDQLDHSSLWPPHITDRWDV